MNCFVDFHVMFCYNFCMDYFRVCCGKTLIYNIQLDGSEEVRKSESQEPIERKETEMFDFLKKKNKNQVLGSPVKGKAVPLSEVNDPTFSEGMLGDGAAVIPSEGKIYAPADGEIAMVFGTLHAISLTTEFGAEILIHIGLDTVKMEGEGFTAHVEAGNKVKKGDLLIEVDLDKVKAAGYDTITPVLICNTDEFASVKGMTGNVNPGDDLVIIETK